MTRSVAIAISGGIDSLVAAALLKEQGYDLIGLHFVTGYESGFEHISQTSQAPAQWSEIKGRALRQLNPIADQLNIPIHIIDLRTEFQSRVVDYFTATYQSGKTPNPCLVCNPLIKFDILLKTAQKMGARRLATGHYAHIAKGSDGRMHLLRGIDPVKEQSYFLCRLTQNQLRHAVLPLGAYVKSQTRGMADQRGLQPAVKHESQDICFIKNGAYGDFLSRQPGFKSQPGIIENVDGRKIGHHNGLHLFTVGQRRGINCPAAEPYYVIKIDTRSNTLVVGSKMDLYAKELRVEGINWIANAPTAPIPIQVRVRYRHAAVPALLTPGSDASAHIFFQAPQPAVTPGQGAVFYSGEEVLGGGWIR